MPGGDVKLFAAVSAWVGPDLAVWILALSTIILMVLLMGKLAITFLTPRSQAAPPTRTDRKGKCPYRAILRLARGMTMRCRWRWRRPWSCCGSSGLT